MTDTRREIETWIERFDRALAVGDGAGAAELFREECFWRDMVAFTWNIVTADGRAEIAALVGETAARTAPRNWAIAGEATLNPEGWTEAWLSFATAQGTGRAHVRLVEGRAWTLLTTLTELGDHPRGIGRNRPRGQTHGAVKGRITTAAATEATRASLGLEHQPDCVIIGGGQGGMALAARLNHLGVSNLILEKNARPGDSWRNRYPTLCLHDPVWYDHMPFIPFPPDWPMFTPKDRMGDWLEMYARVLQLNYWTESRCTRATFDEDRSQWTIDITRAGQPQTITARHLVIATGMSGYPNMPAFEGDALFEGPRVHSSDYRGGRDFRGQRVAVIGSNTSAHDICQDLWEHDAEVTMIQRSGTLVTQSETVLECLLGGLYSEDALDRGIDTETADFIGTTWPHRLVERRMKDVCTEMRRRDADLHDRLSRAGFLHDFGPDETGLPLKSIRQGGGFYINVGASELIADGEVALKPGRSIQALERDGLRLDDGHKVEADAIIYATGYRSMNEFVADIVGRAVADEVGRCWGVGSGVEKDPGPWEGELRNMWKPTAHPALWFQGGNLAQSRHFSRFLALQIKARLEGIASDVWHRPGTSTGAHPEQQPARRSASLREPQTA